MKNAKQAFLADNDPVLGYHPRPEKNTVFFLNARL